MDWEIYICWMSGPGRGVLLSSDSGTSLTPHPRLSPVSLVCWESSPGSQGPGLHSFLHMFFPHGLWFVMFLPGQLLGPEQGHQVVLPLSLEIWPRVTLCLAKPGLIWQRSDIPTLKHCSGHAGARVLAGPCHSTWPEGTVEPCEQHACGHGKGLVGVALTFSQNIC